MTERGGGEGSGVRPCGWCGRPLDPGARTGRPRQYCRRSCRQRAYESRRRSRELGLGEHELVLARADLDALRDQMFVVRRAIDDAERALRQPIDVTEARELLEWIVASAQPLP